MKLQNNKNVSTTKACPASNSRHSIHWLASKQLFYSINKTDKLVLCPAVLQRTPRGQRSSKYENTQISRLGDHNVDRLPPLLFFLPGLPVSITQKISPKLGLANGSTRTIVGCQCSKDITLKSMPFQGCQLRISSNSSNVV